MRCFISLLIFPAFLLSAEPKPHDPFAHGEGISLATAIPANERGILCLALDEQGRVYGGTTGRAAHFFVYDPQKDEVRSLARLEGGVGFAYALVRLPDGSFIGGTQADPTGIATKTDPKAVGHLYRFKPTGEPGASAPGGRVTLEDLGVPVPGQGIYTLAYLEKSQEIVGNTWPDGHFFTYDLKTKQFKDHGAIAGHRPFETPQHAEDVSRGTGKKVAYPRVVSRAIAVGEDGGAYTGGADGFIYVYNPHRKKLEKLNTRLQAEPGREPWVSLTAADSVAPNTKTAIVGTSNGRGYLVTRAIANDIRFYAIGDAIGTRPVHGIVDIEKNVYVVSGDVADVPRAFSWFHRTLGSIPRVDGQLNLVPFGALLSDGKSYLYAGETDRLGRLVRFPLNTKVSTPGGGRKPPEVPPANSGGSRPLLRELPRLPCHITFAPEGTTTDGSGYTAIEVGKDNQVYVGSARYGDYGWLLRFDPASKPRFMEKIASLRDLTGERLAGINTQAKIHAKIVVGPDGRIWFASKQGHEIFDTRPEYDDPNGYPGGHLCWYDPKTGHSRSMGILMRREGLQGGVLDPKRGRIYLRSEPKNHFLVYDIATGDVQDRGHVGAACRYMAIDKDGVVWTVGRGQTLCRYDPETNYVEEVTINLDKASGGREPAGYSPPYVIALGPNGKLYGAGTSHPWIMEFDVDTAPRAAVTMRHVAPAAPAGLPVNDIHAAVFGKDGRFYYPLLTTFPATPSAKPEQRLILMRFDPLTKKSEVVGVPEIVGFDEEKVKSTYPRPGPHKLDHIQGMAVGEDGTLFMMDIYPQLNVVWFPQLTRQQAK